MSDTTATATETTTPAISPMTALRSQFEAAGGKFVNGKAVLTTAQQKEAKANAKVLLAAQAKVDAAQAALDEAKSAVYDASAKLMVATGCQGVTIGGREFIPMAKGERAYYRTAGQRASLDLG